MPFSPLKIMEYTVNMKDDSDHGVNKIAATMTGKTKTGEPFHITRTNFFPDAILETIGKDTKIGSASGSVHAETGITLQIAMTEGEQTAGAHLYVTDPTCVNCAKNAVEAGITKVFIDSVGFSPESDFYERRGQDFENMAIPIYKAAGVEVYEVNRETQKIEPRFQIEPNSICPKFSDVAIKPYEGKLSKKAFKKYITENWNNGKSAKRQVFAMASGGVFEGWSVLSSGPEFVAGHELQEDLSYKSEKYTYKLEPLNKVMMTMARLGMTPHKDFLFSAQVPTSRELVDLVGAGYRRIFIGDKTKARDEHGLKALQQLEDNKVIEVLSL